MSKPKSSTKSRLLRVGTAQFAARGFAGTSIALLAQELGIAKASVLHHYPNKKKIYAAVLDKVGSSIVGSLGEVSRRGSIEERARRFVAAIVTWGVDHPDECRLMLREMLDIEAREDPARHYPIRPAIDAMRAFLVEAQAAGIVRATDPYLIIETLLGAVTYHVVGTDARRGVLGVREASRYDRAFPADAVELLERVLLGTSS